MDANRLAMIRKALEATTDVPDVDIFHAGIYIASTPEPRQRQVDAAFYRQCRRWMRELLDEVEQLQAACTLALAVAERCQAQQAEPGGNGYGPAVLEDVTGFTDG